MVAGAKRRAGENRPFFYAAEAALFLVFQRAVAEAAAAGGEKYFVLGNLDHHVAEHAAMFVRGFVSVGVPHVRILILASVVAFAIHVTSVLRP
jgi:hypothetical protein